MKTRATAVAFVIVALIGLTLTLVSLSSSDSSSEFVAAGAEEVVETTTTTEDPAPFYAGLQRAADEAWYTHIAEEQWFEEASRQEAAAEAARRKATQRAATSSPGVTGSGTPPNQFLACVRQRESGGNYGIMNSGGSGAAGAYQMMPATGDYVARGIGRTDLVGVPANQWPPAVQDQGALWLFNQLGTSPWNNPGGKQC